MIVGLTGGIASGKTFCTDYLERQGITVIDADHIARDVLAPNSKGLTLVVNAFGEEILDNDQHLNRATLRQRVFTDDKARNTLNAITHPLIRESLVAQLESAIKTPYAVLSAPLLFENNLQQYCQIFVLVDVPEGIQLERGSARDKQSVGTIKTIIAKQMSRHEKITKSNYIIDNSGDKSKTKVQLDQLHQLLQAIC